jgi:hypothetical protein
MRMLIKNFYKQTILQNSHSNNPVGYMEMSLKLLQTKLTQKLKLRFDVHQLVEDARLNENTES